MWECLGLEKDGIFSGEVSFMGKGRRTVFGYEQVMILEKKCLRGGSVSSGR